MRREKQGELVLIGIGMNWYGIRAYLYGLTSSPSSRCKQIFFQVESNFTNIVGALRNYIKSFTGI